MSSVLLVPPYSLHVTADDVKILRWTGTHKLTREVKHYFVGLPSGTFHALKSSATHELFIGYRTPSAHTVGTTIYRVQKNFGLIPGIRADTTARLLSNGLVIWLGRTRDRHRLLSPDPQEGLANHWTRCLIMQYRKLLRSQLTKLGIDLESYNADPLTYIQLYNP